MDSSLSFKKICDFWNPIPVAFDGLNNKRGMAHFVYLILLHYFYHYRQFPDYENIPKEMILYGIKHISTVSISIDDVSQAFQNERQLYRYKEEIRKHFGYRVFEQTDIDILKKNFSVLFSGNINKETLKESLVREIDKCKFECLDNAEIETIFNQIQLDEEELLFHRINALLAETDKEYIDTYILSSNDFDGVCQFLRQDSSSSTRENVKQEIKRLEILARLPIEQFSFVYDVNIKQRNIYRRRFLTDTPKRSKRRTNDTRYALAMIFICQRYQEAIDNLVDHLLYFIHQMKKAADAKGKKLHAELGKQMGDLDLLYQLAEINRDHPQDIIEQAVYPEIPQETINQLIKTRELSKSVKKLVQESVIKKYSISFRSSIFHILTCIDLKSNNIEFMKAISLIQRYHHSKVKYYPIEEIIPANDIMSKQQQQYIFEKDESGTLRVIKKDYECAIFKLLRRKLRHKEVWVCGAYKYRDPVDDLPKDFERKREEYFAILNAPLSARDFTNDLKTAMCKNIQSFDNEFPDNKLVNIVKRSGKPWILLTPLEKTQEPKAIHRVKEAILTKWSIIDLLDVLKEVDLREDFTDCFSTAGNREILDRETIRKRLLLAIFAIGTNTGLKRTAGASKSTATFEELRHIKKFFLNKDDLREAINTIINAIFRMRNPTIWRSVSTACAADSKQFGCFTKNLLTEWSPRHHNSGVMIYWHVSDQYICVYSQLKTCTSSEVASMLQGIMSQETDMEIESQYVDSHGKSELGFALSYLEKFDLLPRYKTIGNQKLYLPSDDFEVINIKDITTRCIDWKIIEDQYDDMVKHAVALKMGTATADTIIRKFARSNYQHPTFKAFMELGKAVKTIYLCRYLNSLELRQQINAGLNVVENWNSANDFVYYGKSGEITSNSRDDQEISMLCLHLLQTCISYVNTLLIEDLLKDDYWKNQLGEEDYRAMSALFYLHINPYGTFELDFAKRLMVELIQAGALA